MTSEQIEILAYELYRPKSLEWRYSPKPKPPYDIVEWLGKIRTKSDHTFYIAAYFEVCGGIVTSIAFTIESCSLIATRMELAILIQKATAHINHNLNENTDLWTDHDSLE